EIIRDLKSFATPTAAIAAALPLRYAILDGKIVHLETHGKNRRIPSCSPAATRRALRIPPPLMRRSTSCISCRCRTDIVHSYRSSPPPLLSGRLRRPVLVSLLPRLPLGHLRHSGCPPESTPTIPSRLLYRPRGAGGDCPRAGRESGPCPSPCHV